MPRIVIKELPKNMPISDKELKAIKGGGHLVQGRYFQGASLQGASLQGTSLQGTHLQGMSIQGISLWKRNYQTSGFRYSGDDDD